MGAFDGLGHFIARRYKAVIVLWILALLLAIPFAPQAMDAVEYNMLAMAPEDMDSMQAQAFIDANFNASGPGESTLIVVKASGQDSVLTQDVKAMVMNITGSLRDDPRLVNCTVISIYDPLLDEYTRMVIEGVLEVDTMANGTAMLLFGMPSSYPELWNSSFEASLLLFGISDLHLVAWEIIRDAEPGLSTAQVDEGAAAATFLGVDILLDVANVTGEARALADIWLADYLASWTITRSDLELVQDPSARNNASLAMAYPMFMDHAHAYFLAEGLEQEWPQAELVFNTTMETLLPMHVITPQDINDVCRAVVDAVLEPLITVLPEDFRAPVVAFVDGFQDRWDDNTTLSIDPNWTVHLIPDMAQVRQFVAEVEPALEAALPDEGRTVVSRIYELGWSGWNDTDEYREAVVDLVQDVLGGVTRDLVLQILDARSTLDPANITAMADGMVRDIPLNEYPIDIPQGVLAMLVNVPDNDTMLIALGYGDGIDGESLVPVVREIIAGAQVPVGVEVLVSGSDAINYDITASSTEDMEKIDPVSILLIIVLIGLFFRSLVSSIIPPSVIGIALGLALCCVFFIATYAMEVTNYVLVLIMVTMLGAGCDYGIFILSRYREERVKGLEKEDAVVKAVTWAGESITISGFTVMVGFGVLSISSFSMVSSIGVCLAIGIFLALMAALTFLPSLIMVTGDRVFWPTTTDHVRERIDDPLKADRVTRWSRRYFERTARTSIKHAKLFLVVAILITIPALYVVSTMDTSYDMISTMPDSDSKSGVNEIVEGFGGGMIDPIDIAYNFDGRIYNETAGLLSAQDRTDVAEQVVDISIPETFDLAKMDDLEAMCQQLATMDNVRLVTSPTRPFGEPIDYRNMSTYNLLEQSEYLMVMDASMSKDGTSAKVVVTLADQPFSELSIDTVTDIRTLLVEQTDAHGSVEAAYLTGGTALMYDISTLVADEFDYMEVFAILLIFTILLLILGAVLTPIRSILTILMSVIWTLALTNLVFTYVLGDQLLWLMPIVLIVVCLGLGMDYDIFLTTRIREEVHHGKELDDAIVDSVKATGGIITICGLIMAGAFATMTLSGSVMLQEFGFALAFAILIDATVVRMYLVPAIMSMMGKWNWWGPSVLRRRK